MLLKFPKKGKQSERRMGETHFFFLLNMSALNIGIVFAWDKRAGGQLQLLRLHYYPTIYEINVTFILCFRHFLYKTRAPV